MELADAGVVHGDVDVRGVLNHYGFPGDMSGLKVLDVGRGSGFFSFEFERRGADVLSVDLPNVLDKDFVGGEIVRSLVEERANGTAQAAYADYGQRTDFITAHRILNSKVRSLHCRAYDISPEMTNGQTFDLVFLGSILNHLANPIAALSAVRSVCKGRVIIENPFEPERPQHVPAARFVGRHAKGLTTWWLPTISGMAEMLYAAGFGNVEIVSKRFDVPFRNGTPLAHFAMRADARSSTDWRSISEGNLPAPYMQAPAPSASPQPEPEPKIVYVQVPPPPMPRLRIQIKDAILYKLGLRR
jgi:SAM-dependent methyltransferase